MALIARVWQRAGGREFEALNAPLRSFHVQPAPDGGARVILPLVARDQRVVLTLASADEFQAFTAAAMREAVTHAKRFYKGAFDLRIEGTDLPAARGKRMVSFERDGARIFHAWCEEAILHTVWKPPEMQMGLRILTDELSRVGGGG